MESQGREEKLIPPSTEDLEMVRNKRSQNMAFLNTTLPNAHRHITDPSKQPPSRGYSFDGDGNNVPYMGIDEFFKCVGKDDYEHETQDEEHRKKLGDIKRHGFFSAAANPYPGKLKAKEKMEAKEIFYERTSDNKVPPRPRLPHHSFEHSSQHYTDDPNKYMPRLLPARRTSENITTTKMFSSDNRTVAVEEPASFRSGVVNGAETMTMEATTTTTSMTTTMIDKRLNIQPKNKYLHEHSSGPPALIQCIDVTPTIENRVITTTSTSPTPFMIVSVKSGSETNEHNVVNDTVAANLPQQPYRRTINEVSRQKEAIEISDDQNEKVVSKRFHSESNSEHVYSHSSDDYDDDEDVDILGDGGDDGVNYNFLPETSTEAMDDDGNISDNSCYSEIYNADGSVEGNKPSNEKAAEGLLSLRSSSVGSLEDKTKNTESITSDQPLVKKRGGGKLGRRRKRGYIYDPKPLVPKTKTNSLPSNLKDEEYWHRRQRNNEAAKRSRENRRVKELETMTLVKRLTDNNDELKEKIKEVELRNLYLERLLRDSISDGGTDSGGSGVIETRQSSSR